ncbi:MAG: zinc metallopeptidase [Pseudomonadota bacterium]
MIWVIGGALLLALLFGPQWWVRWVMRRHSRPLERLPGTGGELAHHLVDRFGLDGVAVETTESGDHYDPEAHTIRLTPDVHDGRSLTAVAIAAHEFGHALQHHRGYAPLLWRGRLVSAAGAAQRVGSGALMALPVVGAVTRSPALMVLCAVVGIAGLAAGVAVHLLTLPVETDASFGRALPILREGEYIRPEEERKVRSVLRAAALTYVAAALGSLLNLARWWTLLRGGRLI